MIKKEIPKLVIGRKDKADFPDLGLFDLEVKIDTGAFTSSIHCHNITPIERRKKIDVRFNLLDPEHPSYNEREFLLPVFTVKRFRNSFGQTEVRYVIKTLILLFKRKLDIELSLTDRKDMSCPVLLGRQLLRDRFIVDVGKQDLSFKQKIRGETT